MKFSESWLREWVNPAISTEELVEQLTMAGLEVEGYEPVAAEFSKVVVAEVVSVEPHPDADRLRVCQVNTGDEEVTIVCGAANVRAGLRVPLAKIGARLPGDFKIKKSKLRGVASHGMLCSVAELGLAESAEGLFELPVDAPVGLDIREYLQLDDVSIEVDLTPNRSDCLGLSGIAREVAMLNRCELMPVNISSVTTEINDQLSVELKQAESCPHYCGRIIKGVNATAETPLWIKERLRRSGHRPISCIVDITNYVLIELGQPMHAFDLAKLSGGIVVRNALSGEELTLLDEQQIEMNENTLVIADAEKALALAGIMGGLDSRVTDGTVDIFLESAFFNPLEMAGQARFYRLHTDSSHRFERGVDFEGQRQAIERATALIVDCAGGQVGPVTEVRDHSHLPVRAAVPLRVSRIQRVLGCEIKTDDITDGLQRMGMSVENTADGWLVTPPGFRFDITIEADLVEEVARIIGYDKIVTKLPMASMRIETEQEAQVSINTLKAVLVERGYQEAITYSFVDEASQQLIEPELQAISLANPISSDMSAMRTSLWPGLLDALFYNQSRQQDRVRLFEAGLVFQQHGDDIQQVSMIAGVIMGTTYPEQWRGGNSSSEFHDLKADVEALLRHCGLVSELEFVADPHPALHPGQSASINSGNHVIGRIGALHPKLVEDREFSNQVFLFQLDAAILCEGRIPAFKSLSRFPAVRRDLALIVDEDIAVQRLFDVIRSQTPDSLIDLQLFDVYQGEGVENGKKSCALGLTFQGSSSTLIESEIEAIIGGVLGALEQQLGASLR